MFTGRNFYLLGMVATSIVAFVRLLRGDWMWGGIAVILVVVQIVLFFWPEEQNRKAHRQRSFWLDPP